MVNNIVIRHMPFKTMNVSITQVDARALSDIVHKLQYCLVVYIVSLNWLLRMHYGATYGSRSRIYILMGQRMGGR